MDANSSASRASQRGRDVPEGSWGGVDVSESREAPLSHAVLTSGQQEDGPQGNVVVGMIWSSLGWSSKKK